MLGDEGSGKCDVRSTQSSQYRRTRDPKVTSYLNVCIQIINHLGPMARHS